MECGQFVMWDPAGKQPTRPSALRGYTPLYPVYVAVPEKSHYRKSWFWLCMCPECGEEQVLTRSYVLYNNCTCPSKKPFPKEVSEVCAWCESPFVYSKVSAAHVVQYCSLECRNAAKRQAHMYHAAHDKGIIALSTFDRSKVCVRKQGYLREMCDHYHTCATHRIAGSLGPHYVVGGTCYVYTRVN